MPLRAKHPLAQKEISLRALPDAAIRAIIPAL